MWRAMVRGAMALVLITGAGLVSAGPAAAAALPKPTVSVQSDDWHVNATATGVSTFVWAVTPTDTNATVYFDDMPSPFVVDPVQFGGRAVKVGARPSGAGDSDHPWSVGVSFTVAAAKPTLTVAADKWHVGASLPNTASFVFVVKATGLDDAYFGYSTSPFLVDPFVYGGKTVRVSARAEGAASNPWAPEQSFVVPAPKAGAPVVSVKPDHRHVYAERPGTTSFAYVVKTTGLDDWYSPEMSTPLTIDSATYAGRTVTVSARAAGPTSNPWSSGWTFTVPTRDKQFGMVYRGRPSDTTLPDHKELGVTLDRVEFKYGTTVEEMDREIVLDTGQGLTPLVLLSQYGDIAQFDLPGWQQWAAAVVARYGPGGTFWTGRTDGQYAPTSFEVLNEPFVFHFYPQPNAADYTHFFATVVPAMKAANPAARYLIAGYPGTFQDDQQVWSTQSWDALLKASPDGSAALALANGVTTHPYGSYSSARGFPQAVAVHNDFSALPVWLTEIGYNVASTITGVPMDETLQAAYLQRSLTDFVSWPWAQAYIWFKYRDYDDPDNLWGVVRGTDGTHRPSFNVYRDFIS
jgi:hypothetical protein